MGVKVFGLKRSELIPDKIRERLAIFKRELLTPLVEDFILQEPRPGRWPKSRRKHIQQQTKGVIKGNTLVVGTFHSRYAKALDEGATVRPTKKKLMRFRNEQNQFIFTRKPIYHAPRPFYGRILARVPGIVSVVYDRVFARVGSE